MTDRSAFTDEEWKTVLQAPTSAGMFVITSEGGGSIRESFSMAKAYTEARQQHGDSELLDTIVSTKPEVDRSRAHSPDELKARTVQHLTDAVALLEGKATPEELEEYKRFIVNLAERVAEAHKGVTDKERGAIGEIAAALGTEPPA
jgi:hypothetical protein